ncbi:NAD(P)H-binding protein [Aliiglaciecola sp. 3_MG-2023]|uniref:NAD(P)H-binding protein n=1 Tax=Aliiglaciecola sp. 3_MG-2023 TaxID=3062644 RepID=UPI0026E3F32A|nr:NAD(P)H-binding protein [Aliiglaciecola sp. 3_MG-2023]MDO6694263.1 NAD(P)H-binding protein [Aliiglaciecola sp. 3_MG-2023]
MKTALVLGATGLIGKNLVNRLAADEGVEKVVAVTRRPVEYQSNKIVNQVVNFDELEQYSDVFIGDVLFSCLGTTAKQAGSVQKQRKVDFDYQYHAAKIAAENGVNHYILVSSSGANGKSISPYLKMKGELEDAVCVLPFKRISIVQPSLLIGERETFRLGESVASWILPILCKLPFLKRYRPISGDEVAKKMISISHTSANTKQIYRLDELFG